MARAARVTRIIRIVRLVRLIRIVKLYKQAKLAEQAKELRKRQKRKKQTIALAKAKALAEAQKLTLRKRPSMLQGPMMMIQEEVAEPSSESGIVEKNNNPNGIQEVRSRSPSSFPDSKDDSLIRKAKNMIEEVTPDKKGKSLLNPLNVESPSRKMLSVKVVSMNVADDNKFSEFDPSKVLSS